MRIIKTTEPLPKDILGQLAWYGGFDVLTLPEINDGLNELLTPQKRETYNFEMELQAPLLEMAFNGLYVDQNKRAELIREHETELQKVHEYLHQLCDAIGYYNFYLERARVLYCDATGVGESELPSSWQEWTERPIAWRRELKKINEDALIEFHTSLKTFGPPYLPGNRKEWTRKKNGAFNGNSSAHKLRLFYDFFGNPDNINFDKRFVPHWNKARGIKEVLTRTTKNEWTPAVDRESLEKIQARGTDFDPRDAHYIALPFISCCLDIADYAKALGFLNSRLEKGYYKYSFGAVTDTGRLNSKDNPQGYGGNCQNVTARLRIIFSCKDKRKLCATDFEQIESRCVGAICYHLFGESSYLNATESGDLHSLACSMVWPELPWPKDFTLEWLNKHGPFPADMIKAAKEISDTDDFYRGKTRRFVSKTLGHGTSYMGTPRTMSKHSHIDIGLIEHYQDIFFSSFPEVKRWHIWTVEQIQTTGEISLLFAMTRKFFDRPTDDATIRKAVAHTPQSMAARYTNEALLAIYKEARKGLPVKLLVQKHDEIVYDFQEGDDFVLERTKQLMEKEIIIKSPEGIERKWKVPAEVLVGFNLGFFDKKKNLNPDGLRSPKDKHSRTIQPNDFLTRRI